MRYFGTPSRSGRGKISEGMAPDHERRRLHRGSYFRFLEYRQCFLDFRNGTLHCVGQFAGYVPPFSPKSTYHHDKHVSTHVNNRALQNNLSAE